MGLFSKEPAVFLRVDLIDDCFREELDKERKFLEGIYVSYEGKEMSFEEAVDNVNKCVESAGLKVLVSLGTSLNSQRLIESLRKIKAKDKVLVTLNDVSQLREVQKGIPEVPLGLFIRHPFPNFREIRKNGAVFSVMLHNLVKGRTVREANSAGVYLVAWLVNDAATYLKLESVGINGVITEKPSIVKEAGKLMK
ncbi:MAG: hypothetical protein DRO10_03340 [Thermoprotei archaeon]|nr:MAG: hypothetical protein DRO10_03340 [Thermoprotei archaeon]